MLTPVCWSLTDPDSGFRKEANHLIAARNGNSVAMRDSLQQNSSTEVLVLTPNGPNLNAHPV